MYNDPNQPQMPPPYQFPPPPPYEQTPPYGQPATEYGGQPPYQPTQYAPPPVPGYGAPPPQPKKSLRWLWITLAVVGGLLVLACGGCGLSLYIIGSRAASTVGPTFAATEYYQGLKDHSYTLSYVQLANNATIQGQSITTPDELTQLAQNADTQNGPITSYHIVPNTGDPNSGSITVTVTRNGSPYDVHLTMTQVGGTWKISQADGI
ncbi:MAG: hypothetical protein M3Y81_20150 [Chloroflexota bacterium]|nr:hypothetical protein [Chloroflexota bacterium]